MMTKVADSKGRIALGPEYAGRMVIVEQKADQIILTPAVAIPEREAWLFSNAVASKSVKRGIAQASRREFAASPPDIDADAALVRKIKD